MTLTRHGNTFRSSLQHGSGADKFTGRSEDKLLAKHFALNWTTINQGPVPPPPPGRTQSVEDDITGARKPVAADGLLFQSRLARGLPHSPHRAPPPKATRRLSVQTPCRAGGPWEGDFPSLVLAFPFCELEVRTEPTVQNVTAP